MEPSNVGSKISVLGYGIIQGLSDITLLIRPCQTVHSYNLQGTESQCQGESVIKVNLGLGGKI